MASSSLAILAAFLLGLTQPSEEIGSCSEPLRCTVECSGISLHCSRALTLDSPSAKQSQNALPDDANFIASSRGSVYYWRGCAQWRRLSPVNRRYFRTSDEAVRAGYSPSRSRGCAGPTEGAAPARDDASRGPETDPGSAPEVAPNAPTLGRATEDCRIYRVVDGDTVDCVGGPRLRLLLVDAPESHQGPYGAEATAALRDMAPSGTILSLEYDVQRQDRYGRDLVYAYLADGRMINVELARAGFAVIGIYPPNVRYVEEIRRAIEEARAARRGLWAVSAFDCAPADFRRGRCGD